LKKSSDLRKSPLHPSALGVNDLFVGQKITRFNLQLGYMGDFIVLRKPYIGVFRGEDSYEGQNKRDYLIQLMSLYVHPLHSDFSHQIEEKFLTDMGVTPYHFHTGKPFWNRTNFVVDSRKVHLLPARDPHMRGYMNR